jgi:hypothetical protein
MATQQMVTIGQGTYNAILNIPQSSIDLAKWFFTFKDAEYTACSSGHNGMVQGVLPNGKRVAVSVETIGGNFIVNNFIEDVSQRNHVRAVSDSVAWIGGPDGVYTALIKVTWELNLTSVSGQSCMLNCSVTTETADMELIAMLQNLPQSDADPLQDHWRAETPLFAADIERKALPEMFD